MTPEQHNKYSRDLYHWYRDKGLCPKCGRRYAEAGHAYCRDCQMKYKRIRERTDPDGGKLIERKRIMREQCRAEGLCYDCRKPANGKSRCERCAEKARQSWSVWNIKRKMKQEAEEARIHGAQRAAATGTATAP